MGSHRVSVVTGATSGIGRAMALALAARGDRVVALGRNPERLAALEAELAAAGPGPGTGAAPLQALRLDVSDPGDMSALKAVLEEIGRVDLLVCSAAVGRGLGGRALPPPTAELPLADWQAMIDVNLNGVFLANMAVLPLMRAQGGGDIVNIGSSTTPRGLRGTALAPGYAATKFALAEMGRQLAAELGPEGVRVRTIFPGPVETPLIEGTMMDGPFGGRMSGENFARAVLGLVDLGRDMALPDPHFLPVPSRRRGRARG
jgi:3-oxoacyl-[acyl-carrier protein] reductase